MDNTAFIVSNCLESLGYKLLAKDAASTENHQILNGYIKIAEFQAYKHDRFDILEILSFRGLIYA